MNHKEKIKLDIHKKRKITIISVVSIFALLLIWWGVSLTGQSVKEVPNNSPTIDTDLTIPDLSLNQEIKRIELTGASEAVLLVDNAQFDLSQLPESTITISNFDGKINLDDKGISNLDGKATKVLVNDLPITPKSKNTIKISINKKAQYSSLLLEDIFIDKLSYKTIGTISLDSGKTTTTINNDQVKITNFKGNINIAENKLNMNGRVESLDVSGENTDLTVQI